MDNTSLREMEQAERLFEIGNIAECKDILEPLYQSFPKQYDVLFLFGRCYQEESNYKQADSFFIKAYEQTKHATSKNGKKCRVNALYFIGVVSRALGNEKQEREAFSLFLEQSRQYGIPIDKERRAVAEGGEKGSKRLRREPS